jgi:hypothetical protein
MDRETKVRRFDFNLQSFQGYMHDVERRVLNAARDGGMSPEVVEECKWKLANATELLAKFPEKL